MLHLSINERMITMKTFIEQFLKNVETKPDKIALVYENNPISYKELDILSSRIANKLVKSGAKKEKIYPIILDRSIEYIASIIGILKSGAAFSPLSVEYPQDRVDYIKKDCNCDFLIDDAFISEAIKEEPLTTPVKTDWCDAAQVIYTSGSTGNPKGIVHEHFTFTRAILRQFPIGCDSDGVQMSVTPFNFAISNLDIMVSLWVGATIHILSEKERKDILFIDKYIDEHKITSSVISPQLLKQLPNRKSTLKNIDCGGERISGIFLDNSSIFNSYGLSEVLSVAITFKLDKAYDNTPIGKPLEDFKVFLLDADGNQVEEGQEGEICIAGPVAREYINLPEQTAKTFVENPFSTCDLDKRMMHTNDIGKLLPDGNIVYVNRKDWMIKINGQRVEMGEVEVQLGKIEGIKTAVVKGFEDDNGQTYMCGYYTADKEIPWEFAKQQLEKKFPSYMIPRFLLQIDSFPLNPNGKLDRKALMPPNASDFKADYVAPTNEMEERICSAFEKVLNIDKVGIIDNFFTLGGDSIKVVILQEELSDLNLSSGNIFECKTPKNLAQLSNLTSKDAITFKEVTADAYPMTDSQLGVYLVCVKEPENLMYNNPSSFFFPYELGMDTEKLQQSLRTLIDHYPFLKVYAEIKDGVPCLIPNDTLNYEIPIKKADTEDIDQLVKEFFAPFNLSTGPLFRFTIYTMEKGILLLGDMHHLVMDGTSTSMFYNNLIKIYEGEELEPEKVNSFMLTSYETEVKKTEKYEKSKEFFKNLLSGIEVDSNITPDDAPELKNVKTKSKVRKVKLSDFLPTKDISQKVKSFGLTESTLFLSAFSYALAKQSGQEEAFFCTVENGRHIPQLKNTLGMLVHTLPFYINIDEEAPVSEFMKKAQNLLFNCLENDSYSLVQMASEYNINADIIFVYQGEMLNGVNINGEFIPMQIHKTGYNMANLSLDVLKKQDDYTLVFEYRSDYYLDDTINNFINMFTNIVKGLLECEKLKDITLCKEKEFEFYEKANDNTVEFDRNLTMVDLFREQVKKYPERNAIVFKDKVLTYKELDRLSENLAIQLTKMGVTREVPVGIMVKRSEIFPVCAIAVQKAGGACQPLDSNYPTDRLLYMLEDSNAPVVILDEELDTVIPDFKGQKFYTKDIADLKMDTNITLNSPNSDSLFALIYTSGSTGKPKGCMLEHKNLVNFCISFQNKFNITCEDRATAYGAFGFDASMQDLYPYLTKGACVYIVPEETRLDLVGLNELLMENKITMMDCTTQLGRQYVSTYRDNPYMKALTIGGEKLVPCTPPDYNFVNTYGPTECTIYVTDYYIDRDYVSVPIGKSFGNCDIYIVDKQNRLLPPGAPGELCISGYPVTRGYLNREDLTAEKFIDNPFFNKEGYEKMYLTGDICRYLPDGNIQFVGRRDEQVKIRGFRIELTEIERKIRSFEGVTDASVIAKDLPGGGKTVVAYVVSKNEVDVKKLNAFIAEELPKYMVPSITMQIDKIPLNPNGKVDKRKLPEPKLQKKETVATAKILNSLEEKLKGIISELIGQDDFDISESLVSIGLTSLSTIMLSSKIYENFNCRLSVSELMEDDCSLITVENYIIKSFIENKQEGNGNTSTSHNTENVPLCAPQLGVYYDSMKRPDDIIYNIPMMFSFDKKIDVQKLKQSIKKAVELNPVMTSKIVMNNTGVVQTQIKDLSYDVEVINASEEELSKIREDFCKPFDLQRGPLFNISLVVTEKRVVLLFDVHHIVFDGLSFSVFLMQVKKAYENSELPEKDFSYYDFIQEEKRFENSDESEKAKQYYENIFTNYENASDIPANLHNKAENGQMKESLSVLSQETINDFCKKNSITPAILFLAASFYTVSRYTNDRNVYMSMISNGRDDIQYQNAVGMFVKNLPVHCKINPDTTVADFLKNSGNAMHNAIKNSNYPFIKLFDKYGFASKINYACQLGVAKNIEFENSPISAEVINQPLPKFNVSIHIEYVNGDIGVRIQYNDALYSKKLMDTLSSSISSCVLNMINDTQGTVGKISLITNEEKALLKSFEGNRSFDTKTKLFHKMFEEQVKLNPDNDALIACDGSFSYKSLNENMNRIANALIEKGIKKGDTVAILLPRTSRVIMAMYAIMKAGGTFIPCDTDYPKERIEYIIENSNAKYILTTYDRVQNIDSKKAIDIEDLLKNQNTENPQVEVSPEDTAYMIYTSGSTGKPKGVILTHKGISNYLCNHPDNVHIHALCNDATTMVSVTTVSFDMSLKETGATLCNGLTLVLATKDEANNPNQLISLFKKTKADAFNSTPSRLEQYMTSKEFCNVLSNCKIIICGGEKYSPKLLENLQKTTKARIFNTYGPTEITVSCNAKELTNASEVTTGKPLLNVLEFITDCDLNLLPPGITGELLVGGDGVSKGYLNNPELTKKHFTTFNGIPVYKTGDYAKWTDEGEVIILGRTDNQIKLRGLRIELGEIEKSILADERIKQTVVLIKEINGTEHLCAYYVADCQINADELKKQLSRVLTTYMVPTAYCQLDLMPETPNGKIDVKHLPNPSISQNTEFIAAANNEEQMLCDIFAEILKLDKVGATESFFDLGGTSLNVTNILVEANEKGLAISYGDVFTYQTPRKLALHLLSNENGESGEIKNYDYSKFDDLLINNNLRSFTKGTLNKLGNVLITGAAGFLGIHILYDFLENYDGKIYCLLRGSKAVSAKQRLQAKLFYYFEKNYEELFGTRIFVIEGDVTKKDWFNTIENESIQTVINCAALVKHFSESTDIEDVNIGGVKNLIEFCKEKDSMLVQVSTGSVSGTRVNGYPKKDISLNENMLYFGQNIDNKYVYSKFMGERCVLEAMSKGLKCKIMRVGNLAARDTDGEFQINFTTNGFMGRLKAYLVTGAFPYSAMSMPVEMAPINSTASAILLLAQTPDECCIFHPYNNHYVPLGDIILQMKRMGYNIKLAENDEFAQALKAAENDPEKAKLLTTMLAYENMDSDKKIEMIKTENEYTTQILYRMGFEWSMTSREYMNQFLSAIDGLGFFDLNVSAEEQDV